MITQEQVNKKPSLMADVIDSQVVKTIENSKIQSFNIGKKVNGCNHYIIINTLSLIVSLVLRSMPLGNNVDLGKGYDDMISCATCSLSQRLMQQVLLPCFILVVSSCSNPHVCFMVGQWTSINSVDTFLYLYALPLIFIPFTSSSLCLSAT